jgi:hypothetical protein
MTRLIWDDPIDRPYEFGVDRGVFYPKGGSGYAWSGLVSVQETTVDAGSQLIFIDGVGNQSHLLMGSFAAVIEAITYPQEFEPYDGYDSWLSGQRRPPFDFCYRTMQENGHYKIHLVYNAKVVPTQKNRSTINTSGDISLFSWELSTLPEVVPDARSSSHFVIDTKLVNPGVIVAIEDRLYGDGSNPDMPSVIELLAIFEEFALFRVTPHGDGTVTITGLDTAVHEVSPTLWELDWPSVIQIEEHTYKASSL